MFFQSGWGLGVAKKFVLFNEIVILNKNIFSGLVYRTVSQNIVFFQSGWGVPWCYEKVQDWCTSVVLFNEINVLNQNIAFFQSGWGVLWCDEKV